MKGEKICYAVVFVVEAIITWLYFEILFERKRSRGVIISSLGFGYVLLYAVSLLDSAALNTAGFLLVHVLLLKLCYRVKWHHAVLHAAFLSFVMSAAELLMALLISAAAREYTAYQENLSVMIALAVSSKLLYLLIAISVAQLLKPSRALTSDPGYLVLLCVLPIASVVIAVGIVYIGLTFPLTKAAEILMAASALMLLILNIIFLVVYRHIQEMNTKYTLLQMSSLRDQADMEYYHMLQKQYDGQRILIHDIKNHLNTVDSLAQEGDTKGISAYIAALFTLPAFQQNIRFCNNPVLNVILLRYSQCCGEKQISFECDVRSDCISFIDDASKTALFGNLLSNAVEAAELSREKLVEVFVRPTEQNTVIISIVNSCDAAPITDEAGNLKTRKKNTEAHGFGTKSIERVIKKYGGILKMYYGAEEKRFHCIICFGDGMC